MKAYSVTITEFKKGTHDKTDRSINVLTLAEDVGGAAKAVVTAANDGQKEAEWRATSISELPHELLIPEGSHYVLTIPARHEVH